MINSPLYVGYEYMRVTCAVQQVVLAGGAVLVCSDGSRTPQVSRVVASVIRDHVIEMRIVGISRQVWLFIRICSNHHLNSLDNDCSTAATFPKAESLRQAYRPIAHFIGPRKTLSRLHRLSQHICNHVLHRCERK